MGFSQGERKRPFPTPPFCVTITPMIKKWYKQHSELIGDYYIFKLRQDTSVSPRTGQAHTFYALEAGDWVNVVPVTPAGKVVLIRQYRHGREEICVEIPGGMVDENESPAAAAQRELLEETGYVPEKMIPLGSVTPNPAFLDNECHTYLALNARRMQTPTFDGAEDIALEEVALSDLADMVQRGEITHALVIAAFYHFAQFRQQHPDWQNGRFQS